MPLITLPWNSPAPEIPDSVSYMYRITFLFPVFPWKKKIAENQKQSSAEAGRDLARLIARPKVEVVSLVHQGHRGLVQTVAA